MEVLLALSDRPPSDYSNFKPVDEDEQFLMDFSKKVDTERRSKEDLEKNIAEMRLRRRRINAADFLPPIRFLEQSRIVAQA